MTQITERESHSAMEAPQAAARLQPAAPQPHATMPFDSSRSDVQQMLVGPAAQMAKVRADAGESGQSKQQPEERKPISLLGVQLPGPVNKVIHKTVDKAYEVRGKFLQVMPAPIVNHSPNICGAVQLAGEVLMVRANGTHLVRPKQGQPAQGNQPALGPRQLHHFATDPVKNVLHSVFTNATYGKGGGFRRFWDNKLNPDFYKKGLRQIVDTKAATEAEYAAGTPKNRFVNRWAARSTFSGLVFMTLTALLPEKKEEKVEEERMVKLYSEHPLKYVGERLWQAVNVAEYGEHKRQYLGLGLLISGMCSLLSGFRNFYKNPLGNHEYYFNGFHSFGGAVTAFAGAQLIFSLNNEAAWEKAGASMWLRLPIAGMAITKRIRAKDETWTYYTGGQACFQAMNTLSFLMGGAEKREDGTIVDTKQETKELREKYRIAKKGPMSTMGSHVDALKQQMAAQDEAQGAQRA